MRESEATSVVERLLSRVRPLWRMPRQQLWREVLTLTAVALILLLIELLGRFNRTELFDAASAMALLLTVAMIASWHRRLQLAWTRSLQIAGRRLLQHTQRWRFQWGLDLRREPPVPRACPPALCLAPTALLATCAVAVLWSVLVGAAWREVVVQVSYVVYVVGLATLWLALIASLLIAAFLPAWTLFDMVKTHTNWEARQAQRTGVLATAGYFALVVVAAALLPLWVATLALAVIAVVAATLPWVPKTWYPDCLWRSRATDGQVYSISLGTLFSLQLVTVSLVPLALVLVAFGPAAIGLPMELVDFPISESLARAAAWLCSGGLLVFLGLLAGHLGMARWHDPSRPAGTSLHIAGVDDKASQQSLRAAFARQNWKVRFAPETPQRTDVTVTIVEPSAEAEADRETNSPATFSVNANELSDPSFRERVARRDVIQRRRMLVRGLQSIFRRAATQKDRSGSGYWVAPHYWFVDGLTRDQFDDQDTNVLDVIPPLYYKAFPQAARRHFFEISRALEVDLIYVEDGVDFRNFRRVLRVLFERYDIDGGRQPLSDVHFAGLPKVRVMLHDYNFEEPPLKTKYPEPDYQHLGRVRILHVFRDRGEDEEQAETPEEPDWIFTPDESLLLVG